MTMITIDKYPSITGKVIPRTEAFIPNDLDEIEEAWYDSTTGNLVIDLKDYRDRLFIPIVGLKKLTIERF